MSYPRNHGAILLEAWRREQELTQAKAAYALDMEPSPYCKLETGRRKPGRATAVKIEHRTDGKVPVEAWDKEGADVPGAEDSSPPVVE